MMPTLEDILRDRISELEEELSLSRAKVQGLSKENVKLYNQLMDTEKEAQEVITGLRRELAEKTQWVDLYFGQLRNANERIKRDEDSEKKLKADRDYWKAEALKWCGKLGEIRMLAEGVEYGC